MKNYIGKNCLLTCQNWFVAPDGKEYKSVFGKLIDTHEAGKTLGFIPNRSHANWFIEIGNMVIMGCQVMYIISAESVNFEDAEFWTSADGKVTKDIAPTKIYNANIKA